jgi:Uma2 family endonuclease
VKARRFAALGVPNYWILDPDQKRLECFRNDAGHYVLSATAEREEQIAIPEFPGLTIDLPLLWR